MPVRRCQEPGGRKIRHVVLTSPQEELRLQELAKARGITVARLLMESALADSGVDLRSVLREVSRLREDLEHGSFDASGIDALVKQLDR